MFDCLEIAHQAVESLVPLIRKIAAHDRELGAQIRRATVSIASSVDEGRGAIAGQQLQYFRTALGSAREVTTQLRIARAFGYIDEDARTAELLDRVRAMLWRLTH